MVGLLEELARVLVQNSEICRLVGETIKTILQNFNKFFYDMEDFSGRLSDSDES
jgi:hypothetical protein